MTLCMTLLKFWRCVLQYFSYNSVYVTIVHGAVRANKQVVLPFLVPIHKLLNYRCRLDIS